MGKNGLGIFSYSIIMLTNANHSATFVANKFRCESCDYTSSRKNDWDKHLTIDQQYTIEEMSKSFFAKAGYKPNSLQGNSTLYQ